MALQWIGGYTERVIKIQIHSKRTGTVSVVASQSIETDFYNSIGNRIFIAIEKLNWWLRFVFCLVGWLVSCLICGKLLSTATDQMMMMLIADDEQFVGAGFQ